MTQEHKELEEAFKKFEEAFEHFKKANEEPTESLEIPHYLIEAYKGFYEDEILHDWDLGHNKSQTWEVYQATWVQIRIGNDTPKEHLEIYLQWNGILGYTSQIFTVANGFWFQNESCDKG